MIKIIKGPFKPIIIVFLAYYFSSCSSVKDVKYYLLTKISKDAFSEFCKRTEPITPLIERIQNSSDTASLLQMTGSPDYLRSEFMPCLENVNNIGENKTDEKSEEQLFAYIKEKHPKCMTMIFCKEKDEKDAKQK